jgi:hypothetical protein
VIQPGDIVSSSSGAKRLIVSIEGNVVTYRAQMGEGWNVRSRECQVWTMREWIGKRRRPGSAPGA